MIFIVLTKGYPICMRNVCAFFLKHANCSIDYSDLTIWHSRFTSWLFPDIWITFLSANMERLWEMMYSILLQHICLNVSKINQWQKSELCPVRSMCFEIEKKTTKHKGAKLEPYRDCNLYWRCHHLAHISETTKILCIVIMRTLSVTPH